MGGVRGGWGKRQSRERDTLILLWHDRLHHAHRGACTQTHTHIYTRFVREYLHWVIWYLANTLIQSKLEQTSNSRVALIASQAWKRDEGDLQIWFCECTSAGCPLLITTVTSYIFHIATVTASTKYKPSSAALLTKKKKKYKVSPHSQHSWNNVGFTTTWYSDPGAQSNATSCEEKKKPYLV